MTRPPDGSRVSHAVRLQLLGGAQLTRSDGADAQALIAQAKRFGLLVYLLLAFPGRYHRRDTLLALFWPESDAERARSALRTSLHFLRRTLGPGVVDTPGSEVGLRPGAVSCDALDFAAAIREGRPADALELYRGPLLPGFAVGGAPEVEDWLDRERARLSREAVHAAWRLSASCGEAGDADGTVSWARRAVALGPDDETSMRRLIEVLDRLGDRAGALRAYDGFARRLAQDLDVTPAPETQRLADAIRARTATAEAPPIGARAHARTSMAADPVPPAGPLSGPPRVETSALQHPSSSPAARRRRLRAKLAGGAGVAAASVLVILLAGGSRADPAWHSDAPAPSVERVVVLPFGVHGSAEDGYLGEGMVDLLSAKLDGAGRLRAVDPNAVVSALAGKPSGVGVAAGRPLAAALGATYVVLGSVTADGDRLHVSASMYGTGADTEPLAVARVLGAREEPFALLDRVAQELLSQWLAGPENQLPRLAGRTTTSLDALKLYLQGTAAVRQGRFHAGVAHFEGAVAADSTFALAWYQLFNARELAAAGNPEVPGPLERALRYARRLGETDRLLIAARVAGPAHPHQAERLYRRVLERDPTNLEATYQLADLLFHTGPEAGGSFAVSRAGFERVLELDGEDPHALQHLARIEAWEGSGPRADALTSRALAVLSPGEERLDLLALRAAALGDAEAARNAVDGLRRIGDQRTWYVAWRAAIYSPRPREASALLAVLTEEARASSTRAFAYRALASLELAGGRPRAARARLAQAGRLDPAVARAFRLQAELFPYLNGRCPGAGPSRRPRETSSHEAPSTDIAVLLMPWSEPGIPPGYAEGVLAACRGDRAAAFRVADELAKDPAGAPFAARVRAHVAWAVGSALRPSAAEYVPPDRGSLLPGAHYRWMEGELLRREGRGAEALRWYASIPDDLDYGGVIYYAPAELRQAQILDEMERTRDAARHYARFLAMWRDAEPELQPHVLAAATRLRELGGFRANPGDRALSDRLAAAGRAGARSSRPRGSP